MDSEICSWWLDSQVHLPTDFLEHTQNAHTEMLQMSDFWWDFTKS